MFSTIFWILSAICFALAAFKVPAAIDWTNAGFCFAVIAFALT